MDKGKRGKVKGKWWKERKERKSERNDYKSINWINTNTKKIQLVEKTYKNSYVHNSQDMEITQLNRRTDKENVQHTHTLRL